MQNVTFLDEEKTQKLRKMWVQHCHNLHRLCCFIRGDSCGGRQEKFQYNLTKTTETKTKQI